MSNPQFRLTVYCESTTLPRLRWPAGETEDAALLPQRSEAGDWHEEIYEWALGGGEQVVSQLSTRLVQEFGQGVPPFRRRPAQLREIALAMRDQMSGEWSASLESPEAIDDESAPSMVNASAALVEHLRWVAETFAELPGAHIVVR